MINLQVVYALPENPTIIDVCLPAHSSVSQAIMQSNILSTHNINLTDYQVGIYGKLVDLSDMVNDGDRIEIYRPLINDPKEIRRKRAANRAKKK
ncbi:hypothetical protein DES39_0075 [Orbus hercynius]|uniref:UPF0125 protein DES39_0075 n=1 Tax=Orbus hercynius TaxID=593135 RepID=A0A495RHA6_9GAMM|nr:RnfH family protein [Orbus hercynius]RKS86872.1 hypothetical protein DES39_0075 [Orbus hercynius]